MMIRPMILHRIRTMAGALVGLLGALGLAASPGCGTSASEVRRADRSGYQADFAVVYSHVLAVVAELYPQLDERPDVGRIETSWHQVSMKTVVEGEEAGYTTQQRDALREGQTGALGGANNLGSAAYQRKRYYIRFVVHVVGGNPWLVKVEGRARVWEEGSVPVELRGADAPVWLKGRTDALKVAIYRRLKRYAVKLADADEQAEEAVAPTGDLGRFGDLPVAAAKRIEAVHRAARARDFDALRESLAPAVTYSLGAPPDTDQALVTWRADSELLDELAKVLDAGCRLESAIRVTCPPAYSQQPGYLGYRAGFEVIDGDWKMIFFVTGD